MADLAKAVRPLPSKNLQATAEYKASVEARDSAQKYLDKLKASGTATRQDISAANDMVFKNSSGPSKLESAAYAADPDVKTAEAAVKTTKDKKDALDVS